MSRERSRAFLYDLGASRSFQRATDRSLLNHVRMADREVVLRFCAFRMFNAASYAATDTLDAFLVRATEHLDDVDALPDEELEKLKKDFHRAMNNAYRAFGDHAFRKWPLGSDRRNPINRALFEAWAVVLADYDEQIVSERAVELAEAARRMMTEDGRYIEAISQGTGDPRRVRARFELTKDAATAVLG